MPPVTRQDARRIAEDYLKAQPRPNCDGIEKVFTIPELEEFMIRRPRTLLRFDCTGRLNWIKKGSQNRSLSWRPPTLTILANI